MTVIAWLFVLLLAACSQPTVAPAPATQQPTPTAAVATAALPLGTPTAAAMQAPAREPAPTATGAAVPPPPAAPTAAATSTPTPLVPSPTPAPTPVHRPSSGTATPSAAQPPAPGAATIPIIDVHNHVMPGLTPEAMVSVLDQRRISKIVLMATEAPLRPFGVRDNLTMEMFARYPDRVIPFLGLNGATPALGGAFLQHLDRQLATGKFLGMGEALVRHYGFSVTNKQGITVSAGDFNTPADSPWVQDLMCLAAKHNVILTVHMETEAVTVPALERALQHNPHTKVIWAHQTPFKTLGGPVPENARKADPDQIAALLDKYPNLYADIAPGHEWVHFVEGDRQLPANWKGLYEKYTDRFVVGHDLPFLVGWQEPGGFQARARLIRDWLGQLSPTAQRRLASENMERILAARLASPQTCQFQTR